MWIVTLSGVVPSDLRRAPSDRRSGTACRSRSRTWSPSIFTVQLSGSIGACARYGTSYSASSLVLARGERGVDLADRRRRSRRASRGARGTRRAASSRVDAAALGLASTRSASASRPSFAAQKCFATTATPFAVAHDLLDAGDLERRGAVELDELARRTPAGARRRAVRSPGNWTSMPNCALPVIFSGVSSRRTGVPISFQSFGVLELDRRRRRERHRLRRRARRTCSWSLPCVTTPFATLQARRRDLPARRGGAHQHVLRGRADRAVAIELAARRRRAAGHLHAHRRVARRPARPARARCGPSSSRTRAPRRSASRGRSRCPGPSRSARAAR